MTARWHIAGLAGSLSAPTELGRWRHSLLGPGKELRCRYFLDPGTFLHDVTTGEPATRETLLATGFFWEGTWHRVPREAIDCMIWETAAISASWGGLSIDIPAAKWGWTYPEGVETEPAGGAQQVRIWHAGTPTSSAPDETHAYPSAHSMLNWPAGVGYRPSSDVPWIAGLFRDGSLPITVATASTEEIGTPTEDDVETGIFIGDEEYVLHYSLASYSAVGLEVFTDPWPTWWPRYGLWGSSWGAAADSTTGTLLDIVEDAGYEAIRLFGSPEDNAALDAIIDGLDPGPMTVVEATPAGRSRWSPSAFVDEDADYGAAVELEVEATKQLGRFGAWEVG